MINLLAALTLLAPLQDAGERRPVYAEPTIQASAPTDAVVRLYDVAALTGHARLQQMVDTVVEASSPTVVADVNQRLIDLHDRREFIAGTVDNLIATLGELIEPALVEGEHRVFHVQNGTIALVGTLAQQQWLSQFLASVSKFDGFIDVQARIFVFEKGQLDELKLTRSGQVLDTAKTAQLLRDLEPRKFDHIEAPRVLVSPFQEAQLQAVKQVAYIRDYELKVLADQNVEVADPIIDVAQGGIEMSLRGVPLADGRLSIEADLNYSKLTEPIATFETTIGAMAHPVTIQLPEITRVHVEGRFELFPGETLLMASVDPSATSEALVLVRATLVEAEESR